MEADRKQITTSYPRHGVIVDQILMSMFALISVIVILAGLFFAFSGEPFALLMSLFGVFFLTLTSRWYYLPVEFNQTHIVCKYLLWTRLLPIKNITWIHVSTYDLLAWNFKTVEHESILMKVDGVFLKYLSFIHIPKSDGVGEYLLHRIEELRTTSELPDH